MTCASLAMANATDSAGASSKDSSATPAGKSSPATAAPRPAKPAAIMKPRGGVSVNGDKMERPSSIFVGDRIKTAKNSSATITAEGSTVLVASETDVLFGENMIELGCGSSLVTTVRGLEAFVEDLKVEPLMSDTAKFEVIQANGKLKITAREGGITITEDNDEVFELQQGQTREFAGNPECLVAPPYLNDYRPYIAGARAAATSAALILLSPFRPD